MTPAHHALAFCMARRLHPRQVVRGASAVLLLLACLEPGAVPALAAEPIATTDGEQSGVRLEVTEHKRTSGETLTLKFKIVNDGDELVEFGYEFGDPSITGDYGSVGGVHLVDGANKKKYLVVRDSEDNCLCSRSVDAITPGEMSPL
jgi:hypothetical protein